MYTYYQIVPNYRNDEKTERVNLFLSAIIRREIPLRWIFQDSFTHIYLTKYQVRTLLGVDYIDIINDLVSMGYIHRYNLSDSHGNNSLCFSFNKKYTGYKMRKPKKKRVLNSVNNYILTTLNDFPEEYRNTIKQLRKIRFDVDYETFMMEMDKHFRSSDDMKLSYEQYKHNAVALWNNIQSFNKARGKAFYEFITVDKFGHRLHTPYTSLPKGLRKYIKSPNGNDMVSIDLNQSQPRILSELLRDIIGDNSLTRLIDSGGDVYEFIGDSRGIKDRKDKKLAFFKMIFGYPNKKTMSIIDSCFPDISHIIRSINSQVNPDNPSTKRHSNLAMMLQRFESKVFCRVWNDLYKNKVYYVTIHDEVLVESHKWNMSNRIIMKRLSMHLVNPELVIDKV